MTAATPPTTTTSPDNYTNYPTGGLTGASGQNPYGFNNPFASINPSTNTPFYNELAQYSGPNAQDDALSAAAGGLTPAQTQTFDQNFAENNKNVGFWGGFNDVAPALILGAAGYGVGSALAGAGVAADAGAGAASVGADAGAITTGIDAGATPTLGAVAGDAAGAAGVAGAADALPEITVTAPSLAGAAGAADAAPLIAAGGFDAATGEPLLASNNPQSFLPATGSGNIGDTATLTPDLAAQFGVSDLGDIGEPGAFAGFSGGFGGGDVAAGADYLGDTAPISTDVTAGGTPSLAGGGSGLDSVENWLSKPKNLLQLGGLGLTAATAFSKPKLPGATQTALNSAGPGVAQANSVIQSGGKATGAWAGQKSAIDAQINQQIQQQSEAIMQAAANSGQGNQNSAVVQQQIAQMKQNAEVARQQMYEQAQQQNVNNAIQMLSSDNAILMAVGQQQLALSQEARQSAAETASLAIQLGKLFLG